MLIIHNGTIITGDGSTVLNRGTLYIDGGYIVDVTERGPGQIGAGHTVIDAGGSVVMPGLINPHAHGVAFGPLFATAAPALSRNQVLKNLDRHLRFGVTTLVSMDGFGLPDEFHAADRAHPINLFFGTTYMPLNTEVARIADASGMTPDHAQMTAEKAVAAGAVLFAEIGGGHTLGGGGQDYMYIPMAVENATGVRLETPQARTLKEAVLSRHIRADAYDRAAVAAVLDALNLADKLTPEQARDLIAETVLPSFQKALDGFHEGAEYAARFDLPTLVHNAASSRDATHAIAEKLGPLLIAGHTNHTTYTPEESVASARFLRQQGSIVEICVLDLFGENRPTPKPEHIYALMQTDLVDTLGTDYAGGNWHGVLIGVQELVADGVVTLPKAIRMATHNVAQAIPGVGERGTLVPGKLADIAIVDADNVADVDTVIINGRVAYRDGQVLFGESADL